MTNYTTAAAALRAFADDPTDATRRAAHEAACLALTTDERNHNPDAGQEAVRATDEWTATELAAAALDVAGDAAAWTDEAGTDEAREDEQEAWANAATTARDAADFLDPRLEVVESVDGFLEDEVTTDLTAEEAKALLDRLAATWAEEAEVLEAKDRDGGRVVVVLGESFTVAFRAVWA